MQHHRGTVAPGVRSTAKPGEWELRWEGERGLNGHRVAKRAKFRGTLREARRERDRLAATSRGEFEWDRLTLKEAGVRWLPTLPDTTWGRVTTPSKWTCHVLPTLGHRRVGDLKRPHVVDFMDELRVRVKKRGDGTLSLKSIQSIAAILRQFFRYGCAYGKIANDPTVVIPIWLNQLRDAPPPNERRSLESEEVARLLEAAADTEIEVAVYLGAFAGMRPSEVIGLRWVDVDYQARTLRVVQAEEAAMRRFKGPKSAAGIRVIAMTRELTDALRRQELRQSQAAQAASDRWISSGQVLTRPDGRPFYYNRFNRGFHKIREKAGVACVFYELRHTFASVAVAGRTSKKRLKAAAQQLGHAGEKPLDSYVHPLVSGSRRAVEAVAKHVRKGMEKPRKGGRTVDKRVAKALE